MKFIKKLQKLKQMLFCLPEDFFNQQVATFIATFIVVELKYVGNFVHYFLLM